MSDPIGSSNTNIPVFVATFADGETMRMSTFCRSKLDWDRGRKLARAAWQTRMWQRQVTPGWQRIQDENPIPLVQYPPPVANDGDAAAREAREKEIQHQLNFREKILDRRRQLLVGLLATINAAPEPEPPEIVACHFEHKGMIHGLAA
jgi:hypothetical protein